MSLKEVDLNILVMDDEEFIREFVVDALEMNGHNAIQAENGEMAVDLYRNAYESNEPYNIVFLDLVIKDGIGGLETLKLLQKIDKNVVAMIISGEKIKENDEDYLKMGFKKVLHKPFTVTQLMQAIEK